MKSEPDAYSIDDLARDGKTHWDGVRNYQARNIMRDDMKVGDKVLYYHSNAKPPGVVGLAEVCSEPYADPSQFEPKSKYFDGKSDPENPRWILVDIQFERKFDEIVSLDDLKAKKMFDDMMVTQRGARLSVQPVAKKHYNAIVKMAN